jgi:hypothetical protein
MLRDFLASLLWRPATERVARNEDPSDQAPRSSGFACSGKQRTRRRRPRRGDGPSASGPGSALEIVTLGQVEQPPPGERVCLLGQIARPLREAFVELFHDATPRNITESADFIGRRSSRQAANFGCCDQGARSELDRLMALCSGDHHFLPLRPSFDGPADLLQRPARLRVGRQHRLRFRKPRDRRGRQRHDGQFRPARG